MKLLYILFILIINMVAFLSCSQTIPLDDIHEPNIIIKGGITKNNVVYVDIQETVPVDVITKKSINTAKVSLYAKGENSLDTKIADLSILDERDGIYVIENQFNPIVNNYYWIKIILEDGTVLESSPEVFKEKVEVKSITINNENTRVTFKDSSTDQKDFYLIVYRLYNEQGDFIFTDFFVQNDILFEEDQDPFSEIEDTAKSIEVEISNIGYNNYNFFKNYLSQVEAQDVEDGDFFSQLFSGPPANLEGNIINKTTGKKALGFFGLFNPTIKKQDF
ncbi:hypothetical protein [Tenacibaculum piscium]|uniref:Lipoprotein n=1 Tax=Tenacibaculum piscium TaxID=1458515 RepID=A0A2H1YJV3_9FLAO|nr:hypothetical protein [Tenacibaculum piscium]MBE7629913.1 hypothetical protein [Tenacibaculum piscium]MBE7670325.1 hypothetical protein [Tenacibaculum piscium]MBE7685871.1 hypothetical protein [Tenacibaculum piscium]MBE7690477.1 hypothetical protein [Tenacibaculum piscium]MCG8183803.1 hypothetical protein [Tenacibaculum piscium]